MPCENSSVINSWDTFLGREANILFRIASHTAQAVFVAALAAQFYTDTALLSIITQGSLWALLASEAPKALPSKRFVLDDKYKTLPKLSVHAVTGLTSALIVIAAWANLQNLNNGELLTSTPLIAGTIAASLLVRTVGLVLKLHACTPNQGFASETKQAMQAQIVSTIFTAAAMGCYAICLNMMGSDYLNSTTEKVLCTTLAGITLLTKLAAFATEFRNAKAKQPAFEAVDQAFTFTYGALPTDSSGARSTPQHYRRKNCCGISLPTFWGLFKRGVALNNMDTLTRRGRSNKGSRIELMGQMEDNRNQPPAR